MAPLLLLLTLTMTPEQEVEAWQPIDSARDPANVPAPSPPHDDDVGQALRAAPVALLGAAAGVGGGFVVLGALGPFVAVSGPVVVVVAFVGAAVTAVVVPAVVVAVATDLPWWAGPGVSAGLVVGTAGGAALGALLAAGFTAAAGRLNSNDALGPIFIVSGVGAVAGAAVGAVTSTTIAAFSE